jgi:ABC-type lipoprotein release transport system permease subunit
MTRPGAALSAIVSLALATLETARRAAQADAIAALRVE